MMSPPDWALVDSTRLDLDSFSSRFMREWRNTRVRFLKLECWQAYREQETNKSQQAYESGDIEAARQLLEDEAESDRPLYDTVGKKGIQYARIRLIQEPMTPYLRYELLSYQVRVEMGEKIVIVQYPNNVTLPNDSHFDFLLFDRESALIHDYGNDGTQVGGWATDNPAVLRMLELKAVELQQKAVSLKSYLELTGWHGSDRTGC